MWLLSLLVVLQGVLSTVHGFDCVLETLRCSRLEVPIEPRKDLKESPEAFDEMCKQQEHFYECLEKVVQSDCPESSQVLPPDLLQARFLTRELCSEDSDLRKMYLQTATCINGQITDFCDTPEFLAAVTSKEEKLDECVVRQKAVNCIAVTLEMNCGFEAGNVFHYLLKMTGHENEICNSVGSEVGCAYLGDEDSKADVLKMTGHENETYNSMGSEDGSCLGDENAKVDMDKIYNHLLKRIGDIPDQEDAHYSPFALLDGVYDSVNTIGDVYDTKLVIPKKWVDPMHIIRKDLSAYKASLDSEILFEGTLNPDSEEFSKMDNIYTNVSGNLEYNHTDGRMFRYWRYFQKHPMEEMRCNHNGERFKCSINYRVGEHSCPGNRGASESELGRVSGIIPEEIDPEFGVKWYDSCPQTNYPFRHWADVVSSSLTCTGGTEGYGSGMENTEDIYDSQSSRSELDSESEYEQTVEFLAELSRTDTLGFKDLPEDFVTVEEPLNSEFSGYSISPSEATLLEQLKVLSTDSQPEPENFVKLGAKDSILHSISEGGFESPNTDLPSTSTSAEFDFSTRATALNELFEAVSSASPDKMEQMNLSVSREDFRKFNEMFGVLNFTRYKSGRIVFEMDGKNASSLGSMVCGRVNECHPKAQGVFKCVATPRNVDSCDGCQSQDLNSETVEWSVNDETRSETIQAEEQTSEESKVDSVSEKYSLVEESEFSNFLESPKESINYLSGIL